MTAKFKTREEWLEAALTLLMPLVEAHAGEFKRPRVSVGFGPDRATTTIGWTMHGAVCEDGVRQIFISPTLSARDIADPETGVLQVLLHEICHAALPDKAGHGKKFAALSLACGLQPPWKATTAGLHLVPLFEQFAEELGPYPHGRIMLAQKKKQTTRMLKCDCPDTGYTVRIARKWIDEVGAPICPCCHDEMEVEQNEDDPD